jgi:protein-S-isoprenylcysteine O-methyltransferase Ste14
MDTPPERLVTSGLFAWCRNPMYLGHIVFLVGLALALQSLFAALITAATAIWFQFRVRRDETRLRERFGQPYEEYSTRVRRWIPGLKARTLKRARVSDVLSATERRYRDPVRVAAIQSKF